MQAKSISFFNTQAGNVLPQEAFHFGQRCSGKIMQIDVLPKIQRQLWKTLAGIREVERFYLAGGTAMALHFGHRESIDFDFFRPEPFASQGLVEALSAAGTIRIESQTPDTLIASLSGVKSSFFHYPYPLLAPLHPCEGISVADLKDLAAMKIVAIAQRGVKKDFIDLHAILSSGWNFEAVFFCVEQKYPTQKYNKMHLLKSLTYFEDAERDPMPKMLKPVSWKTVKHDLETAVRKFTFNKG